MWGMIWTDILESPYIWFGVIAYIIVFLLGITTPNPIKKMLGKNWKKLHRFIYISGIAGVIHYFWQLKGNLAEPLLYTLILFFLLGFRVLVEYTRRRLSKMMIPRRFE
jgi:sulfoxide reductase heme-binding subunit YedZ